MQTNDTQNTIPPMPTTHADHAPVRGVFHNYLVLAADMATWNGHQIEGYQWVMTSAESEEDALEHASFALEDGFIPVAAHTAADLRQLADDLSARSLTPRQSYNVSADMTDAEMAEQNDE